MNSCVKKISLGLLVLVALSLNVVHSASNDAATAAQTINGCYSNLSKAYLSLDAKQMVDVYADNGHYISSGSKKEILEGKDALFKLYGAYFARLKKHNSSLDLHFRVSDRLVDTNSISDIGYYVVTIIPPKESKRPPKQHAGKFMITFKSLDNGEWGIWSEANSKATVESYINAKRSGDLHFDAYYPPTHYRQH